ncbi:MAG: response regulator [Verrucomicrobia bacterium]|nr:response regulator [Verrucomicrobiota bacterium]
MSHELRTPLNRIIGFTQVLLKDRELADRNRERLQIVQNSGEHLLRMINEVLDFSKIEAGRMELSPTAFSLPHLLSDVTTSFAPRFAQKNLAFEAVLAPQLPQTVVSDPVKLRQVLENLLGNALKFTSRGRVRLEVDPAGAHADGIRFRISDTGPGIAAEDQARLFQPFQQAATGRPPEPGTGLGLAICQRFVELLGGRITLASTPGEGSEFSFTVPLPEVATDATRPPSDEAGVITGYRGPRRRILVVDDIENNRRVLRELLGPLGFEIHEAADAAATLALVPAVRPDVVLLDLRLPGLDGFGLARRLRSGQAGASPKLIALSASVLTIDRTEAFAAGCDDFLPKPFRESDLLMRLGLALRLEWIREDAVAPPPSAATPPPAATRLSATQVAELLAHARRGEISALRRRLAEHRGDPLAERLEPLAREYRMEAIREVLEAHRLPPAPSP